MGDPTEYLPHCTADDVAELLSSVGFPSAQSIVHLRVGAAYHQVFRLVFSHASYTEIVGRTGVSSPPPSSSPNSSSTASADNGPDDGGRRSLIIRVSGSHIPIIKTANEVAIVTYLRKHTSIPVPQIVHYDDTAANALHHEYMIMTLLPGLNGSDLYPSLSETQLSHILDQLVTINLDLYRLNFAHIGGLKPGPGKRETRFPQKLLDISIIPGPPLLETMWQSPDIDRYFNKNGHAAGSQNVTSSTVSPSTITFASFNAVAPVGYASYTSWLTAQMNLYLHAVDLHPSLNWIRQSTDPTLTALHKFTHRISTDPTLQEKLNDVSLKLAHRDLHFGNILLTPQSDMEVSVPLSAEKDDTDNNDANQETGLKEIQYMVTGVLDWEFACVLPFPLWRHSFLADNIASPPPDYAGTPAEFFAESRRSRERLFGIWARKASRVSTNATVADRNKNDSDHREQKIGQRMLKEAKWRCAEQQAAWDVVNFMRCIVEVCPRDQQHEDARSWWREVARALHTLRISN